MDKNQKKIMPGCEKLTRPEEISALKNYLKQGIQENENSLVIGDENLLMSTPGDPILGEIDLENQKLVMIDGSSVDIKRKSVNLDISGSENKAIPGDYLDKIKGGSNDGLTETRVNLEVKDLNLELPENLQNLNLEKKKVNLENKKINLDLGDNSNPEVESYRESLSALSDEELSLFSFLSELPGKRVDVEINDHQRVPLDNINNEVDLGEKKISLEKNEDPELKSTLLEILKNEVDPEEKRISLGDIKQPEIPEKRVSLEKNEDPELKSTLLEILKNEVDPEEKRISLESINEVNLSENKILLRIDKETKISQEIKHSLNENPIDPETNIEKISASDNQSWIGENNSHGVNVDQHEKFEILRPSDPGSNDITTWDNSKTERGDSQVIFNSQFGNFREKLEDNAVNSGYTTWGVDDSGFDVEHDDVTDENPYVRRDLGDNNLIDAEGSKLSSENLSGQIIQEKNKLPRGTKGNQNSLHNNGKATSWKTLSSKESSNFDYEHGYSEYSRDWIGDNNLKADSEISRFGTFREKLEDNAINSGYTTWGTSSGFDVEHDNGSSYGRRNLGDNNLISGKDSSELLNEINSIETGKPKKELDLNFKNAQELYKLENITDASEKALWQGIYGILGDIEDKYKDTHIGDGWKEQLLSALIEKNTKYNSAKSRPNNTTNNTGDFTTWGINQSGFDLEHGDNNTESYERKDLGDNNLTETSDTENLKKELSENSLKNRRYKLPVNDHSGDSDYKSDIYYLGDNRDDTDGDNAALLTMLSKSEREKRPFHQNSLFTIGDNGKLDLGSALKNPYELFTSGTGSSGIISGLGQTLNTEISITPILRSLAETISLTPGIPADVKQDLIDSVLKYLVELRDTLLATNKVAPYRLPGADANDWQKLMSGGSIKDMAKNLLEDTSGRGAPINRPKVDKFGNLEKITEWSSWGNDGVTKTYRYFSEYSSCQGLGLTLEDLCDKKTKPSSLEDLKKLLSSSPYITTAENVKQRKMTLDSNHTWELRLFPFLGDINGNCSWLPNISEINSYNWEDHGVKTRWGEWLPVTSFELQSRKMTQKTLGLYDGEISYPVSMEFSNEVRLTLVDDQYKSWKRYFELCAECSTYLTEMVNIPSNKVQYYKITEKSEGLTLSESEKPYNEITENDILSFSNTTPIVKGVICPGMYKNLTFRCLIYVMTPQMSTIQKFDLLLVLKDYSIEYSGEIDSSSPDLNISFSIVGENPGESIPKRTAELAISEKEYKQEGFFEKIKNDVKDLSWKDTIGGVLDILS